MARSFWLDFAWNGTTALLGKSQLKGWAALEGAKGSDESRLGRELVKLISSLSLLRYTFLTIDERHELGDRIAGALRELRGMEFKALDPDLRRHIAGYLSLVEALAASPVFGTATEKPLSLLEALSTGQVNKWTDYFYAACHGIEELTAEGYPVRYVGAPQQLSTHDDALNAMLHWLSEQRAGAES